MGGKLKQPLTKEQSRKRGAPLRRHKDRQRALWLIVGGVEVALVFAILKMIGV